MNRRRSAQLRSSLDASFQIPLTVNSAANNLLLEDDVLEHDFFNGLDYTLSTPVPEKVPTYEYTLAKPKTQKGALDPVHSEEEGLDHSYDYAQEERKVEMDNELVDEQTPRRKRVHNSADREMTPTPRAHTHGHKRAVIASTSPAPASRTSVANEDYPTIGNDSDRAAVHDLRLYTRSPSTTPKPKRSRRAASQAQPSVHSMPVGATPSSLARPDKTQLRAESREPDAHMLHHEHAPSARRRSAFSSQSESDPGMAMNQTAPALAGEFSHDPHFSGKRLSEPPESSRVRRPSTSQRRQSRSRTRSSSPLLLSHVRHDAVMLPIQEEEEDLQTRGEQLPIPKPQQSSGLSEPGGKAMVMTKDGKVQRAKNRNTRKEKGQATETTASYLPTAGASSSRLSPKGAAKRNGDKLSSQPAPKKRKTEVIVAHSGSKLTEDGRLRASPGQRKPAEVIITAPSKTIKFPSETVPAITDPEKATPSAEPVGPESNLRSSSLSLSQYSSSEARSELPLGDVDRGLARHELHEATDEVQDFLSRYAKKYGPYAEAPANKLPIIPKLPVSLASAESSNHPQASAPPKRRNPASVVNVPKGERCRARTTQPSANPELKGKLKSKASVATKGTKNVISEKVKVPRAHSASGATPFDSGTSGGASTQTENILNGMAAVSEVSNVVATLSVLESPASQEAGVLPVRDHQVDSVSPGETQGTRSNVVVPCLMGAGTTAEDGGTADPRVFEAPVSVSTACTASVLPDPTAAASETRGFEAAAKPAAAVKRSKEQSNSHGQKPVETGVSKNPPSRTVSRAPQKASTEPSTDDMFARKKRDNYLQKGLDLTAHSSRRYVERPGPASRNQTGRSHARAQKASRQVNPNNTKSSSSTATRSDNGCGDTAVTGNSRPTTRVMNIPSGAGDQKPVQSVSADLECKDPSNGKKRRTSRNEDTSETQGKQSAKPDFHIRGEVDQKVTTTLSEYNRGYTETLQESVLENTGNTSTSSTGGVFTERLVNFSHRILGSFGLLSSQPQTDLAEHSPKVARVPNNPELGPDLSKADRERDPRKGTYTLHSSEPSPRKSGQHRLNDDYEGTSNDDNRITNDFGHRYHTDGQELNNNYDRNRAGKLESNVAHGYDHHQLEVAIVTSPPLRKSQKRSADHETSDAAEGSAVTDLDLLTTKRSRKRTRLSRDEGAFAAGSVVSSNSSRSDRPRDLMSSRARAADTKSRTRGLLANAKGRAVSGTRGFAITRNSEPRTSDKPSTDRNGAESSGPVKNLCNLTVPVAPAFTGDVLREQRVLAKAEREREKKDEGKTKLPKSDDRDAGSDANTRAPLSSTQATSQTHEPSKPIVPLHLHLEMGSRQMGHRGFNATLQAWEKRASATSSTNSQGASRKALPDFKSLHAAQGAGLANMAARRQERIAPTIPVSPHFVVDIRLADRHKFEETRRAREKEAERMVEEERRAREIEEEHEWREARKRTVPRASAVPEWYAEVPKRAAHGR